MFAVKESKEVNEDPIDESRYCMRKRDRKYEQKY